MHGDQTIAAVSYLIPIVFIVLVLDRASKAAAVAVLAGGREIAVVPGALHLNLVLNKGAAFGLFSRATPLLILFAVMSVFIIVVYLRRGRAPDRMTAVSMAMILGGAVGNLADRVLYGHVIDFIDIRVWPVFNAADSFITIGAAILIWKLAFGREPK